MFSCSRSRRVNLKKSLNDSSLVLVCVVKGASPLYTNSTHLYLLSASLRGQPGHIVRLVALTSFAPGSPSPSRYRSFFPIYFLPLLQPSPSACPLLRPRCLSRCLPKVAWPNAAAPFVDITQSGCLPPCQTPLAVRRLRSSARFWCRLCWWMLRITLHAIVSWHSPH